MAKDSAERIAFLPEQQVMEVDFSDLTFDVSQTVNAFYDEVDRRVRETGRKWFFLVNYRNTTIMTEAWITFAHRGKKANITYSLGSARYAASENVDAAVRRRSTYDNFDPNLFPSREAALAHLAKLRAAIPQGEFVARSTLGDAEPELSFGDRILFHPEHQIVEVDLSGVTFEGSRDVNRLYDALEAKLAATGRKWFFLVNYGNCTIMPDAWVAFASRGKRANLAHSLGSVRFDATTETSATIVTAAARESFDANLLTSRDAAVARIGEMRKKIPHA
jgi:hypothetical protein